MIIVVYMFLYIANRATVADITGGNELSLAANYLGVAVALASFVITVVLFEVATIAIWRDK